MLALVKKNAAFFIPYSIFLLGAGIILIAEPKTSIHLFINGYHCSTADTFFKYWTLVGLGWLILPVLFILAFVRLRYVIMAAGAFLIAVIINDTLKFAVGAPRPAEVFQQLHQTLYFVPGVDIYHWNSFPSGHSAISFCLFCVLALISSKKALKFILFLLPLLVAYSRMYLSEHFLIDVYVGSFVGVISAMASYRLSLTMAWINKLPVMDKPVITLRRKPS